jgi:hypothetical protein
MFRTARKRILPALSASDASSLLAWGRASLARTLCAAPGCVRCCTVGARHRACAWGAAPGPTPDARRLDEPVRHRRHGHDRRKPSPGHDVRTFVASCAWPSLRRIATVRSRTEMSVRRFPESSTVSILEARTMSKRRLATSSLIGLPLDDKRPSGVATRGDRARTAWAGENRSHELQPKGS